MAFQKLPQVTVTGRLTGAPELRFTGSGLAVASFTVAASERKKNQQTQEWEDGDKCFLRCTLWREEAENLAESDLQKGAEVTVSGELFQREYQDQQGQNRQSTELKNVVVSAVVSRGQQVQARKVQRQQGGQQQQGGGWAGGGQPQGQQGGGWQQGPPQGQGGQQGGWQQPQQQGGYQGQQDPWGPPGQGQGNQPVSGPWSGQAQNQANGYDDEPPF